MHLGSSRQKVLQLCKPPLRPLFKFGHSLSENSFSDLSHSEDGDDENYEDKEDDEDDKDDVK